jgi:type II secretion system protein N
MTLDPRLQRLAKLAGYPLLGLFFFLVFLYLTFPYERLKHQLEDHIAASGRAEVTIGSLGPRLLLGVHLEDVVIRVMPQPTRRSRPTGEGGGGTAQPKPQVMRLAEVGLSPGIFAMLGGGAATDFDVALHGGGAIEGSLSASKTEGLGIEVHAEDLHAQDLPLSGDGPPLAGRMSFDVDLQVPEGKWTKAEGSISFGCANCTYGDGKALLKIPGNPFLEAGLTVPRIQLGRVAGQIEIDKGTAQIQRLAASSRDLKFQLLGAVRLFDPIALSRLKLKIRFKIEDALKQKIAVMDLLLGQLSRFKEANGFYVLPVTGSLSEPGVAGMRRM